MGAQLQAWVVLLDGSPIPLSSTAAYESTPIASEVRARWESLDAMNKYKLMGMSI